MAAGERRHCVVRLRPEAVQRTAGPSASSALGLGRVKTPTFDLRVEIPSRFRQVEKQLCLRPLLREDDRENNSAHSWLVHVFTQPGSKADMSAVRLDVPFASHERTFANAVVMSAKCQKRTSARLFDHHVGDPARF
jgi:hypothetical protein